MFVIYRISDTGYQKDKPDYINNRNCFENALRTFNKANWWVIADNVGDETKSFAFLSGAFFNVYFPKKVYGYTTDTDIVLSSTDWNGANIDIHVNQEAVMC